MFTMSIYSVVFLGVYLGLRKQDNMSNKRNNEFKKECIEVELQLAKERFYRVIE